MLLTGSVSLLIVTVVAAQPAAMDPSQFPALMHNEPFQRWWALFAARAYPLGHIPEGAKVRALEQIKRSHSARAVFESQQLVRRRRWVNIGPAPISGGNTGDIPGSLQPASGRVAAIAVDPGDVQHWLIGAAQGGIWETRDAGSTWVARTDAAASLAMGAIAFAASDPTVVYAGTGEAVTSDSYGGSGMLKSTDGGATWLPLAVSTFSGAAFRRLQVDPNNARVVVAATRGGGYGVDSVSLPNAQPTGLVKSSDGGVTWAITLTGRASALEVDPGDFRRQFGAIGAYNCKSAAVPCVGTKPENAVPNGVYRSTDAGESWLPVSGPWDSLPAGAGRIELALAPSDSNVLYVGIQDAFNNVGSDAELLGLWKATDAWSAAPSWTQINTGAHGYCAWDVISQQVKAQCDYDHALLVHPTNPNVLYAGGVPLWKFDGHSWTEISRTADAQYGIHVDQQTLAWAGNRLVVGNDGGLWSTADDGGTWTDHNTNLSITQFYDGTLHPTDPNFALGASQDNNTEKWTGSEQWQRIFPGDGIGSAISDGAPNTHWAGTIQYLSIWRTVNGGATFEYKDDGIDDNGEAKHIAPFLSRLEECPARDGVFIAGTDNVWKTTNFFSAANPTWSRNSPDLTDSDKNPVGISALAFAPTDPTCSTYAYGTEDGRLFITSNGGRDWSDLDPTNAVPDRYVSALAFDPVDAGTLYVTLSGFDEGTPAQPGHLFKAVNASATPTWSNVGPPVNIPHNAIAVDSSGLYVGTDLGAWESTDGGTTWTHMGPEVGMPNVAVFSLRINPTTNQFVAFTHGRGAFALEEVTAPCPGGCSGMRDTTTKDDVLTLVNISLGNADISTCTPGDTNRDGQIKIGEIIQAVDNALNGCGG